MTDSRAPHTVLGVSLSATPREVEHAFHRLVRLHHPDTAGASGDPDELTAVLAAYAALRAAESSLVPDDSGAQGPAAHEAQRGSPPVPPAGTPPGAPAVSAVSRGWDRPKWLRIPGEPPEPPLRAGPVRWHRRGS
jgi:curved DNA-binding protein CbpA